jgi:hypothetical protein
MGSCEANEPIGPSAPGNLLNITQRDGSCGLGEQDDPSQNATKGNPSKVEPPRWRFAAQVSPPLLTTQLSSLCLSNTPPSPSAIPNPIFEPIAYLCLLAVVNSETVNVQDRRQHIAPQP